MAGITAHGSTFTFNGVVATVVGIQVETPVAEIVDMTPHNAPAGQNILMPTGHWTGGSITVDYLVAAGGIDPQDIVRTVGPLSLAGPSFSVTRNVILEKASVEARVGDAVRGTLTFLMTDHYVTAQ
jgi:hypothetical protein